MRKALLLLLCCISSVAIAETRKEIKLKQDDNEINPLSIVYEPTAYQNENILNIWLPSNSSFTTISIINNETGIQVYSMIYAFQNEILIDLDNNPGNYTIYLNIEGTKYIGQFTL